MQSKIDKNLLNIVHLMTSKNDKVDCLIYANNYFLAKNFLKRNNYQIVEYPFIRAFGIKADEKSIKKIANLSHITYISSIAKVSAQMNIAKKVVGFDDGINLTGEGVTIAVIDTGISEHLDFCSFQNRILFFKDFVNNIEFPYDDNGHGTFVCGALCGNGFLSGKKYSGIAPKSNLIVLKALDKNGETGSLTILEAMQWIYDNQKKYNIRIVCMSLGSQPLENGDPLIIGAETLWNSGIVVVAAAGNSGPNGHTIKSPGASGRIITVGAIDDGRNEKSFQKNENISEKQIENNDINNEKNNSKNIKNDITINKNNFKIAEFSSRGPSQNFYKPDCVAPGVDIVSTSAQDIYTKMSGTSVSTPIVAGACALIIQKYPNISPFEVKRMILNSSEPFMFDKNSEGFGVINIKKLCS